MKKISIGILAYNEAAVIYETLKSLRNQTLFDNLINSSYQVEISVISNGCTDNTSEVAYISLEKLFVDLDNQLSYGVHSIKKGGKSNAWNVYVHEVSDNSSDYLFLMDADIEILDPNTLLSMINVLERSPEAWISVDKPIKDILLKTHRTLMEQLSVFVSGLSGGNPTEEGPAWICGQLYCARSETLRRVWMPTELPVEDGFLYTMTVTDGMQTDKNIGRVILAKTASHKFEAYTSLDRLLRHEKWLILSSSINEMVFPFLVEKRQGREHIGLTIERLNKEDENWLSLCIKEMVDLKGYWLIPRFILLRRFIALRNKPFLKALFLLPVSICAFFADLFLSIQANQELHRKSEVGYWGK